MAPLFRARLEHLHRSSRGALLLLFTLAAPVPAQAPRVLLDSPRTTHDSIQVWRERANDQLARGDTMGLQRLRALLDTLRSSPQMEAMSAGYMYLGNRTPNIYYDLLTAYLRLGRHREAIDAVEAMVDHGPESSFRFLLRSADSVLADSARYRAARQQFDRSAALFTHEAFQSAPSDPLTAAQRVAGLSLVWQTAREYYPEIMTIPGGNWDSLYMATLPEVLTERDTFRYHRLLQRFVAALGDAHSNVYSAAAMMDSLYRNVALTTALIDSAVLIVAPPPPALLARGFAQGQEIVAIDGIAVRRYVADRVAPYISAATPQDRAVREFGYELLRGPRADSVRLTVREARGRVRDLWAPRTIGYAARPAVDARREDAFGYVSLRTFDVDADRLKARFDSLADALGPVRGWILDLRENGGGSSWTGWSILAEFLSTPIEHALWSRTRRNAGLSRARGEEVAFQTVFERDRIEPDARRRRMGPVAVLIGPATFSAAEDFLVAFRTARRGVLVGTTTGGSTGQPLRFSLPGGAIGRVRVKDDRFPSGQRFINIGIAPDLIAPPTVADVRQGRDGALARAVAWLRDQR